MTSPDTPYDPNLAAGIEGDESDWDDAPIVPRARVPRPTKLLLVVVVAAAAFAGGIFAQRHWGKTESAAAAGAATASRVGGAGGAGGLGRRFGGTGGGGSGSAGSLGGATIGQVAYLRGNTLYVTTTDGNTVEVAVPRGTHVTKSVTTTVRSVRPGDTVVVRGSAGKAGTITAQNVSIGGFGGGGSEFGATGGSTGATGAPTGFGGG